MCIDEIDSDNQQDVFTSCSCFPEYFVANKRAHEKGIVAHAKHYGHL
jgi:hypothetical protein